MRRVVSCSLALASVLLSGCACFCCWDPYYAGGPAAAPPASRAVGADEALAERLELVGALR